MGRQGLVDAAKLDELKRTVRLHETELRDTERAQERAAGDVERLTTQLTEADYDPAGDLDAQIAEREQEAVGLVETAGELVKETKNALAPEDPE